MITEIVLFRLPDGMSRQDAIAKYRLSIPTWQANPDLIRKAFLFDENTRRGGAVYHWKSIEAAKLGHGPDFQKRIQSTFGSQPEFQYFETPIVLDNTTKQVVDEAASNICATSPQAKATAKKVGKEPLVWEAEPSIAIHHAQDHVAAVTAGSYHVSATVDLVNGREVAGHSVAFKPKDTDHKQWQYLGSATTLKEAKAIAEAHYAKALKTEA